MKITYKIALIEPCAEDWEAMKPQGCGRFCVACEKTVVDFTTFSDKKFIAYLRKNNLSACGRFTKHQLSLEISWLDTTNSGKKPTSPSLHKAWQYAAVSLLPLALPVTASFGQEPEQYSVQHPPAPSYPVTVSGTVLDEQLYSDSSSEEGITIMGPPIKKQNVMSAPIAQPVTELHAIADVPPSYKFRTGGYAYSMPSLQTGLAQYERPLIVLNGKQFTGKITDIDPLSVKTVKLLKDVEARALYGAAGADGVLVITTEATSFWHRFTKLFRK